MIYQQFEYNGKILANMTIEDLNSAKIYYNQVIINLEVKKVIENQRIKDISHISSTSTRAAYKELDENNIDRMWTDYNEQKNSRI